MARYLDAPNECGGTTDHSEEVTALREQASKVLTAGKDTDRMLYVILNLAADLLQSHDETGISLDDWPYARQFVEMLTERPILPNCV